MKFFIDVDPQPDGSWVANCPTVPDCRSTGATREEAVANLEERIREMVPARTGGDMPHAIEIEER